MTSTLMSEKIFAFGQRIVAFLWARRFSTLNAPPENLENVSCDPYEYHGRTPRSLHEFHEEEPS